MSTDVTPTTLAHLANLTSSFGKKLDREQALAEMNDLLAPLQRELEARRVDANGSTPIFILGAPRSGTTVVSQLLSSSRLFGFISNFVAGFWRAPAVGMIVEAALGLADEDPMSSFESRRGTTSGWREPSEFGYFWSHYFDMGQGTHQLDAAERQAFDADELRRAMALMESVAGRRIVFKNNTWFTLNADMISGLFPAALLVVCERDPFYIAQSIWYQRLDLYGDQACWWSVRPSNYREIVELEPLEQVAAQAVSIVRGMEASLARVTDAAVLRIPYGRLASDPRAVVGRIARASSCAESEIVKAVADLPKQLASTDRIKLDAERAAELRRYVDRWSSR